MKIHTKWLFTLALTTAGLLSAQPESPNIYLASPCYTFNGYYRALWLQPTASNLCYGAEADPLPAPTPNWKIHDINTDYNYGYEVGLGAIIHDRNTKLKLSWSHFTSSDSNTKSLSSQDMIGPLFEIGPDSTPYNSARGRVNFDYDYACIDYGILVNFGCHLLSNFYLGISGAKIKQELVSKFVNPNGTIRRTIKTPSRFMGIGPQFGVESQYSICRNFKLFGEASAALLVGGLSNHTTYKSYSPALANLGITPPNEQKTKVHHRTGVVPAFEGRLALGYTFKFQCLSCADFDLEAGYKGSIFINAVQTTNIGSEVLTPPVLPDTVGVYARTFRRDVSNFALAGPYVSLNVRF